jgi:hypothetical protein
MVLGLGCPPAWSRVSNGGKSQWLYIHPLRLPLPPYNGSPLTWKSSSGILTRWGSTPLPWCAFISAASTGQRFHWDSFAAHIHAVGPNTAALRFNSNFVFVVVSASLIFFLRFPLIHSCFQSSFSIPVGVSRCQGLLGSGFIFLAREPSSPPDCICA